MSDKVKPKKSLGQHFLNDPGIVRDIAELCLANSKTGNMLEIGPGTGVLTKLIAPAAGNFLAVELDTESVAYLKRYPELDGKVIEGDFLKMDMADIFGGAPFDLVGNFPYNISSQIFFKMLERKDLVLSCCCMLQKEVAMRLASPPGKKDYGILSVLLQAFYDIEYCFTVEPHVFIPPPKVKSGVIKLTRNKVESLPCDEKKFKQVIKQAFGNRRKTLRNSLKSMVKDPETLALPIFSLRAEQLGVNDFVWLANIIEL